MVKAVLTTKIEPGYDDLPEQRYHFQNTYLRAVERAVGDLIVYYEPRRSSTDPGSRGGRQAYFAVARVDGITPDEARPNHFYAAISDFLEFDRPVPFREGDVFLESFLRRQDGGTSKGAFGRSVRPIPDEEFEAILRAGFTEDQVSEETSLLPPGFDYVRPIIQSIGSRPFRDQAFKRHVRDVYGNRCAMTGLKIINGGGRPEVQAAHIQPVARSGPDSVRNGIALSSTVHWMFDRGLVSIGEDFRILLASDGVPEEAARMLNPDRKVRVPSDDVLRPHGQFLDYHRKHVFKG